MLAYAGRLATAILTLFLAGDFATAQPKDVKQFCLEMEGKQFWLKIGVIRIQHPIGGTDATNVYPGNKVYYRAKFGGLRQIQSSSAEDFAEEARIAAQTLAQKSELGLTSHVRHWARGSKVTIHKIRAKKKEIQLDVTEDGGSKSRVRFKFEKDMGSYNLDTVQQMFAFTFTENEADLAGAEVTVKIILGMTVEEVLKVKGKPKSEVDLGSKVILVYDDMKLIFKEGKLADVE